MYLHSSFEEFSTTPNVLNVFICLMLLNRLGILCYVFSKFLSLYIAFSNTKIFPKRSSILLIRSTVN